MTNLEYYWDKITHLRLSNVGVKNGKPKECTHMNCLTCDLFGTLCDSALLKWLLAEHKDLKEYKDENTLR